jgi:glycine/D-amino acid oxidase-like deaminating enzyme
MADGCPAIGVQSEDADVLVVGGGTAGAIAAIQAARAGARTAIVEMTGQLGGTITNGGVGAPALFWTRDRQVIAGIGWELVEATLRLDNRPPPDFTSPPKHRPQHHVGMNRYVYALLAEEAALRAGVTIHYHEIVVGVRRDGERWAVETVGKNLRRTVRARELIDCTGDADVVGMLGLKRLRSPVRQPGTLTFRLDGYDPEKLDAATVEARYERAMASGELRKGDYCMVHGKFMGLLRWWGQNQLHVLGADSDTSDTQTQANLDGRAGLLRLLRFIKTLPGCQNVRVQMLCTDTAVRETWRIVGERTITEEDFLGGRAWDDSVCYAFYFIDVHTDDGGDLKFLNPGAEPTVPLGALVPQGSRNLLVAGRCVSSDRRANSALRVEASCMAMGQAAGAAAALGVKMGVPSRDVPIGELKAMLAMHGAIVPPLPKLANYRRMGE